MYFIFTQVSYSLWNMGIVIFPVPFQITIFLSFQIFKERTAHSFVEFNKLITFVV